jgi:hypothetical protein
MQVLEWFLAYYGIDEEQAREIVEGAIGGQFASGSHRTSWWSTR